MRGAMHLLPFVSGTLQARNSRTDFVVQYFGAAAGNGGESGIAQTCDCIADRQAGNFGDA